MEYAKFTTLEQAFEEAKSRSSHSAFGWVVCSGVEDDYYHVTPTRSAFGCRYALFRKGVNQWAPENMRQGRFR